MKIFNQRVVLILPLLLFLFPGASTLGQSPSLGLPSVQLSTGIHLIHAELADNDQTRARGLMFRERLAPNTGMVFVFEQKATHCMWMKNTLIPLSVAFIEDDGSIINIETMQPRDEKTMHCAKQPVRYALEMSAGWFDLRGIKAGLKVQGLPKR